MSLGKKKGHESENGTGRDERMTKDWRARDGGGETNHNVFMYNVKY